MVHPTKAALVPAALTLAFTCAAFADAPPCERMTTRDLCLNGVAQHAQGNLLSLRPLRNKEVGDPGRFDLSVFCTDDKRLMLSITNRQLGTIALTYSALIGTKGLGFSMFPISGDRQSISGPTPGSFAVLNKCKLLRNHLEGVLFNGSQIMPQKFYGVTQTSFPPWELVRDKTATDPTGPDGATDQSDREAPTDPLHVVGKVDLWDFSGLYEFAIPDFYCRKANGFMPKDYEYDPIVKSKAPASGKSKDQDKICPDIRSFLVIEAVMAKQKPIMNLDIGAQFVIHLLDGPDWRQTERFSLSSPSGDTTQVARPIWQVKGRVIDQETVEVTLFGPRGQRGEPFRAKKVVDYYQKIGVRPPESKQVGVDEVVGSEQP
jgi:hypothetical protein